MLVCVYWLRCGTLPAPACIQVRWVAHKEAWATAADDEVLRLWSIAGERMGGFAYKGGSCRCAGTVQNMSAAQHWAEAVQQKRCRSLTQKSCGCCTAVGM